MKPRLFVRPGVLRRRVAIAPDASPVVRSGCPGRAPMSYPTMRRRCRRTVPGYAPAPHSDVQIASRQRAAPAAPPLPLGQRCAPRARLVDPRSRERMREAETEGKRKGPARDIALGQSARGVGAARRVLPAVPSWDEEPGAIRPGPRAVYAVLRWTSLEVARWPRVETLRTATVSGFGRVRRRRVPGDDLSAS